VLGFTLTTPGYSALLLVANPLNFIGTDNNATEKYLCGYATASKFGDYYILLTSSAWESVSFAANPENPCL
jgi:hypothetical protein